MENCNLLTFVLRINENKTVTILSLTEVDKFLHIKNPIAVLPMKLPMIVPQKKYSNKKLGGYLLNDVEYDQPLFYRKP